MITIQKKEKACIQISITPPSRDGNSVFLGESDGSTSRRSALIDHNKHLSSQSVTKVHQLKFDYFSIVHDRANNNASAQPIGLSERHT